MKTIVRTYAIAATLLAAGSLAYYASGPKAAKHNPVATPVVASLGCCADPPPCNGPGEPPCWPPITPPSSSN